MSRNAKAPGRGRRVGTLAVALLVWSVCTSALADDCVVSILNRTATIQPDGSWSINNLPIPAPGFRVRARFTCIHNGVTLRSQSPFVEIKPNATTGFQGAFVPGDFTPIPAGILLSAPVGILQHLGDTTQLMVVGTFPDGSTANLTNPDTGTMYRSSMPDVATVSAAGLVTAVKTGRTLLLAQHEGRLSTLLITVCPAGDTDGDGLPDNVELANGLDPNNPLDGAADFDADGLTNAQEVARGTNLNDSDSDDDGVLDGAEVAANTDPTNANSVSYAGTGLLASIAVAPNTVIMRTNTIIPQEISRQLAVTGTLVNGFVVNLTSAGTGTTYFSNNLSVVNFGDDDGRIFAGNAGMTSVLVSNSGRTASVPVTVTSFTPTQLAAFNLPSGGFANNCDVEGAYCYIADGPAGLRIVDVSNPALPVLIRTVDTPGNANDVKVSGNTAFIADGSNGLVAVNIANPATAAIVGSLDTPGNATDVRPCGDRCYVADGATGLLIVDVCNPAMMVLKRTVDTPGTAYGVDCDPMRGIACVADGAAGLQVVEIEPEAGAHIIGSVDTRPSSSEGGLDVFISGTHAYVADGTPNFGATGGLVTVDITNPAMPIRRGTTTAQGNYFDVVVDPVGLAFCADNLSVNAVHPFTLIDPDSPTAANAINFTGDRNGNGIDIQGGLVFMVGTVDLVHHGAFASAGTLHIARYLDFADVLGVKPTVQITTPANGASFVVGDTITIQATANDDVGVSRVEFYVGSTLIGTDSFAPYQSVHAPLAAADDLRLRARAIDYGDNASSFFDVFVDVLPNPAPVVHITSPGNGSTAVRGAMLDVAATAMDNGTVSRVDFSTSAGFMSTDMSAPYTATVPVPTGAAPTFQITATAMDSFGATGSETITVNLIDDPLTTVIGNVVNSVGTPLVGANVHVIGADAFAAVTVAGGAFSIANVPTIHPPIEVMGSAMSGGLTLMGKSAATSPVPGGTTNVGTITLLGKPPTTGKVAYLDDRQGGTGNEAIIAKTGKMSLRLFDSTLPTTDLIMQFDVLILALGNGGRNTALVQKMPGVLQFVRDGGVLILHDSNPGANATGDVIPGLNSATFQGLNTSSNVDIDMPTSPLITGPFGTADNTTLDGGNASTHGWVLSNTLPAGVDVVAHNAEGATRAVIICYRFGEGSVIWSSIPAEFYMPTGNGFAFGVRLVNTYLPNELTFALKLRDGTIVNDSPNQDN